MKKILSFTLALIIMLAMCIAPVSAYGEFYSTGHYTNNICELLEHEIREGCEYGEDYSHLELYFYYGNGYGSATLEEATPDYVLIYIGYFISIDWTLPEYVGEYVIFVEPETGFETGGYYIYVPAENELYSMAEALEANIEGIDKAFSESNVRSFCLLGDVDRNFVLNVNDATIIQKYLANIPLNIPYPGWIVPDFNRDGKEDVKDATAIQKHIAGLEY